MSLELMTAAASAPRMTHCASERSPLLCPPICNDMSCLLAPLGLSRVRIRTPEVTDRHRRASASPLPRGRMRVLVRRLDHLHPGPPYDARRAARQPPPLEPHLG